MYSENQDFKIKIKKIISKKKIHRLTSEKIAQNYPYREIIYPIYAVIHVIMISVKKLIYYLIQQVDLLK